MERRPDIVLVGTGHVFDLDTRIQALGWALRPDVVAIELDGGRLRGLEAKERGQELPKAGGPLLRYVSGFQERMAASEGVLPGADMLAGRDLAKTLGVPLALIDRPMQDTMAQLKERWGWKERLKLVGSSIWEGIKPGRKSVQDQLDAYMRDPSGTLSELAQSAPQLHEILVAERDQWMAKQLAGIRRTGRYPMAFIGDAHRTGIERILKEQGFQVQGFSLQDLENGRTPQGRAPDWPSAQFA